MPTHSDLWPGAATPRSAPRARARESVVVVVPTRNEAATIAPICTALAELRRAQIVDRVLVVDDSTDETAARARAAGAEVRAQSSMRPEVGPLRGKGDAMWRAVASCTEDVVVFVDGDTANFDSQVVVDLVGAIRDGAAFAKADYRRPWDDGATRAPTGGGRVTELTAKPLLRQLFPELAAFGQPLAGEIAGRRDLLRTLPFVTGYGVDVALLIDAWRAVGFEGLAQVNAAPRQNRHRPLHELAAMADEVAAAILDRAGVAGAGEPLIERAPLGGRSPAAEAVAATW